MMVSPGAPHIPLKRRKWPVKLDFIVFAGLFCGLLLRIRFGTLSSQEGLIQDGQSSVMVKTLMESRQRRLKTNESSSMFRTAEKESSKPLKSKVSPVEEKIVTSSNKNNNFAFIQELMALAGADYSPCIPQQDDCDPTKGHVIRAFNSWHQPRYLCGQVIKPRTFVDLKKACHEGIRIFQEEPSLTAITITPIDILIGSPDKFGDPVSYKCPVPCRRYKNVRRAMTAYVDGIDFQFQHSMESSVYYDFLTIRPHQWRNNRFYATTSFKSEVPRPYFSWTEYSIQKPAVDYDASIKGASFIASNCASMNGREGVVTELMKMIRVDNLGTCLNNGAPLPKGSDQSNKVSMQNKYLLHFAFENSNSDDYITEKLWGSFESGTLPVYMGAPNVQDHVPEHSIISVHDFPSTQALGEYLQQVLANKTLYESYHEWRTKPLSDAFHRRYDMTHTHSVCRTCKFVYAKTRGWGWNSERQEMTDLKLPRKVCMDEKGLIVYPFVEAVVGASSSTPGGIAGNSSYCNSSDSIPTAAMVGPWQRTIWFHDGVIDITLDGKSNEVYRISTPLVIQFKALQANVYQVQDGESRITIVGDSILQMSVHRDGVLDIRIPSTSNEPQRLRVIIEDIDKFHAGADSVQNYFGKSMVDEFQHPLQFVKKAIR